MDIIIRKTWAVSLDNITWKKSADVKYTQGQNMRGCWHLESNRKEEKLEKGME